MKHQFCLNEIFEMTCKECGITEDHQVKDKSCGTCPDCNGVGRFMVNGYRNQPPDVFGFVVDYDICYKCRGLGDLNKLKLFNNELQRKISKRLDKKRND